MAGLRLGLGIEAVMGVVGVRAEWVVAVQWVERDGLVGVLRGWGLIACSAFLAGLVASSVGQPTATCKLVAGSPQTRLSRARVPNRGRRLGRMSKRPIPFKISHQLHLVEDEEQLLARFVLFVQEASRRQN